MAIRLYLYLLLSLVTCLGCKAQIRTVSDPIIVSPQAIVDSVSYEIVRDSVYCEKLESYYHYRVLDISHPNKAIENKINFQLLGLTDSMFDEKETLLYKSIISKHCNDLTMLFAFGTSDYQVEYNNNGLLSVLISFDDYDFYVTHKNHMNFDLLTGNKVELSDVFKVEPTSLISMINQQIVEELEFSRKLIIEREEFETISLLKNLDFFLKNKKKPIRFTRIT